MEKEFFTSKLLAHRKTSADTTTSSSKGSNKYHVLSTPLGPGSTQAVPHKDKDNGKTCVVERIASHYSPTTKGLKIEKLRVKPKTGPKKGHKKGSKATKLRNPDAFYEIASSYMTLHELLTEAHVPDHMKRKPDGVDACATVAKKKKSNGNAFNTNGKSTSKSNGQDHKTATNQVPVEPLVLDDAAYDLFLRGCGRVYCCSDPAQPVEPDQQLIIIKQLQEKNEMSEEQFHRYLKLIHSIPDDQILEWPKDLSEILKSKAPIHFIKRHSNFKYIFQRHYTHIKTIFSWGLKKSILDYILKDSREQERLKTRNLELFTHPVIRGPIPWHIQYQISKESLRHFLFLMHPVSLGIKKIWEKRYCNKQIVDMEDLKKSQFPMNSQQLQDRLQDLIDLGLHSITKIWLPDIANLFTDLKASWVYMVPNTKAGSLQELTKFFASVCSLMSRQLRDNVFNTLIEIVNFFCAYKDGNDYGADREYNDLLYLRSPILKITLIAAPSPPYIRFDPDIEEPSSAAGVKAGTKTCNEVIKEFLLSIINSCKKIPRIERKLFPELRDTDLHLFRTELEENQIRALFEDAQEIVKANMKGPLYYIKTYEKYLWLLDGTAEGDLQTFLGKHQYFKNMAARISDYELLINEICGLDKMVSLNFVELDCQVLNDSLVQKVHSLIATIVEGEVKKNRELQTFICRSFEEMSTKTSERVETTAELVQLTTYMSIAKAGTYPRLKNSIAETMQRLLFLLDYHIFAPAELAVHNTIFHWPKAMEETFDSNATRLQIIRDQAEEKLEEDKKEFEQNLQEYIEELQKYKNKECPHLRADEMKANAEALTVLNDKIQECIQISQRLNQEEIYLDQRATTFNNLQVCIQLIEPYFRLWTTANDFHLKYDVWFEGPFAKLDADSIVEEVEMMWKLMYKLSKTFSDLPGPKRVADTVRGKIERFRQHLPLLVTICNPGIRDRHWAQMSDIAGVDLQPAPETSLSDIIDTGASKKVTQLEEISAAATKEFYLEKNLSKMQTEWSDVKFDCIPYRDTGVNVLSALDDIQSLLDDHILKAQTMKGSPFIKPLEAEMKVWEDKLVSMQNILDSWIQVQSTWMYLYAIFSSPDIVKQMPSEARKFHSVDKLWRNLMKNTAKNPKVLTATEFPNMLRDLNRAIIPLEEIQVGLNEYLEKKRHFFPRFFFLSNDELLEILSETKDPLRVQPHLKKCFEGIHYLEFTPDMTITHMISAESEKVPLSHPIKPLDARGMVEKWLAQVETQMFVSVRDVILKAVNSYGNTPREDWVLKWPGQAVLCGDSIFWTKDVSDAIVGGTLKQYLTISNRQIDDLVKLVRGKLTTGQRVTLGALIVIAVHARDVVADLNELIIRSISDFHWISQLRYYVEGNSVILRMITTEVKYGYEYLGNSSRLVITPLTDRCYRTLMSAIKLNLGGAPEGPAGTGKTETCKDLAKAVAKQCVVFNCSDGLDYKAMGKFFKGLAQSGSWCIFDEFNRIVVEVLSVVAQQILTIQKAIGARMKTFMFENTELTLVPTCSIFITMNPGYAGRQDLPDNLKVLFRTVAMMVPDYVLIGQISLYSMGFVDARSLARKIVDTYRLCSEQLSSQHHYDYGMRAVKSVLTAAGNLKLKHPGENEARLVLKAISDVNLPKFLAQDIPLFEGIITDLFPDYIILKPDLKTLTEAIRLICSLKNLQATPFFLEKTIQIYEMVLVRHGLMIVGEAMGGKTSAYQAAPGCFTQVLAAALTEINLRKMPGMKEHITYYRIMNPKSVSLGQLYGCFDPVSHEWSDGVLATAFRAMVSTHTPDRKWIVFDGPVDAIWVENMNTVLDDNKKLCLMSGEIIQMTSEMNMLFEPADLEHASPATVSRCGMIYMEPKQLGWQPLRDSFIKKLPAVTTEEQLQILLEMFDWLFEPSFDFIRHECEQFVKTSELHLFQSFVRIYSSILQDAKEKEENQPISSVWLQSSFVFALIWGLGSTLTKDSRLKFDAFYRHLVIGNNKSYPRPKLFKLQRNQIFPDKNTCFDFVCDKKNNQWLMWTLTIDRNLLVIHPNAKVTEIIVPTDETARQLYFLKIFLGLGIPFMFLGPTGTGKSAITINYIMSSTKDLYVPNVINFSARTSANQTQDIIMSKLDRRKKGVYGPPIGKQCIVFVDDLNMPQKEMYGSQPPIELLRQWIDHGIWFDRKDTTSIKLEDLLFLTAMGVPGGGRNDVSSRFLRHLSILAIDAFDDVTMKKIFCTIADWHFAKGYDNDVSKWTKPLVQATMNVYKAATNLFLPTPAKSHYIFNLRDFSRVIRGLLLIPPNYLKNGPKLHRLWVHEIFRVFHDRLVSDEDRQGFFELVSTTVRENFKVSLHKLLEHLTTSEESIAYDDIKSLIFGDFLDPHTDVRIYDEISDLEELSEVMGTYMSEYNTMVKTPMNLVLFKYAVEHISRISRVLKQDSGHALLIGIGGSGRQSLTKLATFMAGYDLFQVEISRTYGIPEWREDLKKILKHAGNDGRQTVFLFADTQIKDESFVEDINMLLNTGDIPSIFPGDEKGEILEKMQLVMKEGGKKGETSALTLYNFFIDRVRTNVHIVLAMSPVSDSFRHRLRMFPSLINCCTIDWFTEWPQEALEKVAKTFLVSLELEQSLLDRCVYMCKHFHDSVRLLSTKFCESLGRYTYVTPTSYLELILAFKTLLGTKRKETEEQRERYLTGLEKLDFAAAQVIIMQNELTQLQPILIETSAATEKLMIKIERDTVDVEATKEVVAADEALANEAAAASQAIKDDCENDLAEAIPALEAALQALDTLKPADVTVVKSMKNPPGAIKMVLEAICIMRGIKCDRKTDQNGKQYEDYWGPSMKMLGDLKFLEGLKEYDKDNVQPSVMKKIREKFIKNPDFEPSIIRNVSTACEGLCKWVKAMEVYDRVIKIVEPKKLKLLEAEGELQAQMDKLNEKRAQLQRVTDKLQALNDEYAAMNKKKRDLEDNIGMCSQKLERAEKLIDGLSGEKQRWGEGATQLSQRLDNIFGDVLISAAVVSYLGPFTVDYRQECFVSWQALCAEQEIPCSAVFSLISTLGDPVKIRNWNLAGLPIDVFSIDNAIVISNSRRWPLMIDPQAQASKWIRTMETQNNLGVTKLSDPKYLRVVEAAIQLGHPVLIDNIPEELDPALEPVLLKQTFRQGPQVFIKIGENVVEYHDNFRLYLITRLRNPHYLPEIAVKVTLLNFMITPMGLQDQLLGIVAAKENPSLEEQKNRLVVEGVNNKNLLKEIEDKILKVLSSSKGNILEDESGIQILSSSKELSEEILAKQNVAVVTEKRIDVTRNLYRPVAIHSSTLFFCISELANIDPMYQYSLNWFVNLYKISIRNSKPSKDLTTRIHHLNDYFTSSIYRNVCRSVFEKDKLVFPFVLCAALMRSKDKFRNDIWNFILTGGVMLGNPYKNPAPDWLMEKSWSEIVRLSDLEGFTELRNSISNNTKAWRDIYQSKKPQSVAFPEPWGKCAGLDRLAILRCLRSDKLVPSVQNFIVENIGKEFIEPPNFDLNSSFEDSSPSIPLIFMLSAGSDPMTDLIKFGIEKGVTDSQLVSISLGQGQGPVAEKLIEEGVLEGGWVVLQNCHLATSWMPTLEMICQDVITSKTAHKTFRLWLTSYPSSDFPITVLQNGIKLTNEAPQGLRSHLLRSYKSDPIAQPEFYQSVANTNATNWHKMVFGLCFFHALVQERRKYGPLGWNIAYEFNESDLKISLFQLQMFLQDYETLPLVALTYLTGECNYGGRVTDDKDRRLLMSLLSTFYSPDISEDKRCAISPCGKYCLPEELTHTSCLEYIRNIPLDPSPEVFGLHANASITKGNQETMHLLSRALMTQSAIKSSGSGETSANKVIDIAQDILNKLPDEYDVETIERKYPVDYMNSMNTVLRQELIRFNRLVRVVRESLENVQKAIKGLVVMSPELDEIYYSMLVGKVPVAWAAKSYPSLKPLGGYVIDLLDRLHFFQNWIDNGAPQVFWLSGFYFTQSFLTGISQNYARRYKIPIDDLGFDFEVTAYEAVTAIPEEHVVLSREREDVMVEGLFLEGARWDRKKNTLAESKANILYDKLPIILFKPGIRSKFLSYSSYDSPVYKTSARQGTLSTTGHSTNFVMFLKLKTNSTQKHWIDRGTACVCQLDD